MTSKEEVAQGAHHHGREVPHGVPGSLLYYCIYIYIILYYIMLSYVTSCYCYIYR